MTAGSDVGLLGRETESNETDQWRIWTIADENRRATVPYNMEKNEETIVAGMQLDFTATKKLEKPLYPDEDPPECDALPILWVLNTSGQLAGWTVIYVPGIKAQERLMQMMPVDWQDKYWQKEQETRQKRTEELDEEEKQDMKLWEKVWREKSSKETTANPMEATVDRARSVETPLQPSKQPSSVTQTSVQVPTKPAPVTPSPSTVSLQPGLSEKQHSQPTFGKPSPLGASTFGQTGQLGSILPAQAGMYSSSGSFNRAAPVLGQTGGSTGFGSMSSGGFAKYSSSQSGQGGGFLSGPTNQSGSFLSGPKGGSFLDGGQKSFFFEADQDHGFGKYSSGDGIGTSRSATTSSSFSGGGFLANKPAASSLSPFGASSKSSSSQRTQSLTSPGNRIQTVADDSSQGTESDESDIDESLSEDDVSVNVDAVDFGDSGFNLNLSGKTTQQEIKNKQPIAPIKSDLKKGNSVSSPDTRSSSLIADTEYIKASIPITPSPQTDQSNSVSGVIKDLTPSARDKPRTTEESQAPRFQGLQAPKFPNMATFVTQATPAKPIHRAIETAIMPPDPFAGQLRLGKHEIRYSPISFPPAEKIPPIIDGTSRISSKNKMELQQPIPVSGASGISSRLSDSSVSIQLEIY